MTTNCVKNADNTYTLTCVVEGDAWKKAKKAVVEKYRKNAQIKGFRKGQVPAAYIRKMLGKDGLNQAAVDEVAQKAYTDLLEEYKDVEPIAQASLDVNNPTEESVELVFTVPVEPKAVLGEWKNLGIEKKPVEVTDEEVEQQIKSLQEKDAEDVLVEGEDAAAQDGDKAEIDFVGKLDGEAFDGGSAQGYSLTLGSGTFIPGFEEQVIGMKPGEEKDLTVTFPEDYANADLAGKEVVFTVKLNDLYRKNLPELNDEFAAGLKDFDVETMDDLRKTIRERIENYRQEEADDEFFTAVLAAASANADVVVPEAMINAEVDRMIDMQRMQIERSGYKFDQFLQITGTSLDDLKERSKPQAETRVRNSLILRAIADAEQVEVTEEDVAEEMKLLSETYNMDLEQIKNIVKEEDLRKDLRLQKASELLVDNQ